MPSVLIVEDDVINSARMATALYMNGFSVTETTTVQQARTLIDKTLPDLMALDIELPDGSGLDLIQEARDKGIGIICISNHGALHDRLTALHLGSDSFLAKPASSEELVMHMKNLYQRLNSPSQKRPAEKNCLKFADWVCDPLSRRLISPGGEAIALTPGEFNVLWVFLNNPRNCLSRDRILDLVGTDEHIVNDRAVDVMVHRLRNKIEVNPKDPQYFVTIYGVGYIFSEPVQTISISNVRIVSCA